MATFISLQLWFNAEVFALADLAREKNSTHLKATRAARLVLVYVGVVAIGACNGGGADESSSSDQSSQTTESSTTDPGTSTSSTSEESGSESETGEPDPIDYSQAGAYAVGNVATFLADPEGLRDLDVELWYPASRDAPGAGQALVDFALDDEQSASLAALIADAPDDCVRKQTASDAAPALADIPGPWPTLVFSHCHGCARFSSFSIAEHLASHGFLVAAVDHPGSTIFDQDMLPPLDVQTRSERVADVTRVIDALLDPANTELPADFVGLADPERFGMYGHSFGAVTTGAILQDDDRVQAGVAIAAPVENPLLPGVMTAAIDEPLMLMVAVEDNSITELGNAAMRQNFIDANSPAWKLEFADTGHFAYADLAGLSDYFAAGCGEGLRQTDQTPFTYHDPFEVRSLTAARVAAFFALHLLDDPDAQAQLEADDPLLDIQTK